MISSDEGCSYIFFNPLSPMTLYSQELIRSTVATDSFSTLPQKVSYNI